MCTGLEIAALAGAGATAYSAYSSSQTAKSQLSAQKQIATQAAASKPQPAKAPDSSAISAQTAAMAGTGGSLSGNAGTFLTGPAGVDPGSLNLGKNTLLGQ